MARKVTPDKPYVQSITWDGKPYTKSWFSHAQIAQGGAIVMPWALSRTKALGWPQKTDRLRLDEWRHLEAPA